MSIDNQESAKPGKGKPYHNPDASIQSGSESANLGRVGEGVEFDPLTQRYIMAQQTTMSISGPLPPSAEFAGYNQALPGAAHRILAMAEKEQDARLFENRWMLGIKTIFSLSGQIIAACLVFTVLRYSYDLALQGQEQTAIAFSTTTIGAILAGFLVPKLINSSSRGTKEEAQR